MRLRRLPHFIGLLAQTFGKRALELLLRSLRFSGQSVAFGFLATGLSLAARLLLLARHEVTHNLLLPSAEERVKEIKSREQRRGKKENGQ